MKALVNRIGLTVLGWLGVLQISKVLTGESPGISNLTLTGTKLLALCDGKGWLTEVWRQLPVIALSIGCFALAQSLGGSGFIASFAGGIFFGWVAKEHRHRLLLAAEGTGDTLALITWVVFGAVVVGDSMANFTWQVLVYALLSLTVIRMLPVFLVLSGTGLRTDEKLFMGWFGPRGLASIVFGVIVLGEQLPGAGTITTAVALTIILSIIAHGISANTLARALAVRVKRRKAAASS